MEVEESTSNNPSLDPAKGSSKIQDESPKTQYKSLMSQDQSSKTQGQSLNAQDQSLNSQVQNPKSQDQSLDSQDQSIKSQEQSLNSGDQSPKSQDQSFNSQNQSLNSKDQSLNSQDQSLNSQDQSIDPTGDELAVLDRIERLAFHVTHRMNQGRWKLFWTWCQRTIGSRWIQIATYNLMNVYGLEHLNSLSHGRPLLLVANHRSFFDMYTVSSVLFRRTSWKKLLYFPVRSRFFYESPLGMLVNLLMGWWSMYPPIFAENEKRLFDKYSVRRLAQLCRHGAGHVIGFHPEGTRNRSDDPYSYLRAQPGVGKLIKDAAPQVVPVFIAGLGNSLVRQVVGNWTGGEKIRIRFGAPLDLSPFLEKKDHVRTYKEISEFVMSKIAELGEEDRTGFALSHMEGHGVPACEAGERVKPGA